MCHIVIRGLVRDVCSRNVPSNDMDFLEETEMMAKKEVALEKAGQGVEPWEYGSSEAREGLGEDTLAGRSCGGMESTGEHLGYLLSLGREIGKAAGSATQALKSLALVSFTRSPPSCQLPEHKECVSIVSVSSLQNLVLFDRQ